MSPRDYKAPAKRRAKKRQPVPGWIWFLGGLSCGALASWMVYTHDVGPRDIKTAVGEIMAIPGGQGEDGAVPEKESRPRFEFYTMLPEMEVAVPDEELDAARASEPAEGEAAGETYILQVGSFRLREEAERLKANLAFLGLEAGIQTVSVNGEDTWHRVRLGPFVDLGTLNEARSRLRSQSYESMVLKVRG